MSKKLPKTSPDKAHAEILQHFLPIQLLPDEDPETHEALRDAILLDLKPGTPYERILAEQLVTLEWEALRRRKALAAWVSHASQNRKNTKRTQLQS